MKKPSDLSQDMHALLRELNTPAFPEGVTEMDVVRFLSGAMPESEQTIFEQIMVRHPDFEATVAERRRFDEMLFSQAKVERPTVVQSLRDRAREMYAVTRALFVDLIPASLYPEQTLRCDTGDDFLFGDTVDERLYGSMEPDAARKGVRVLIEIADLGLAGKSCRLVWGEGGHTQPQELRAATETSRQVATTFLLAGQDAEAAAKTGFSIEFDET